TAWRRVHGGCPPPAKRQTMPETTGESMMVQPFAQYHEIVEQLAMIPHAVTVLTSHVANPAAVEQATVAQAFTVRQLLGPGAGGPTREPHLQRDGKALLGSFEQVRRDESSQKRLQERLPSLTVQEPVVREPQR